MPEERFQIETPRGPVSAAFVAGPRDAPVLVVGHGAGAGMDHPFMAGFCRAMGEGGVGTLRFNFPYMEVGRRSPDAPGNAIAAFAAAFDAAVQRAGKAPVFAGGKSYGGRIASMAVAEGMPAHGLVFLGYPLHAPGKAGQPRDEHLYGLKLPMLFLHGTKDPFAEPATLAKVLGRLGRRATHVPFEGAGHSFERSRKDDAREIGASLAEVAGPWIKEHV
jgi:predicted alpha/beta-hydrolase family hydrolase